MNTGKTCLRCSLALSCGCCGEDTLWGPGWDFLRCSEAPFGGYSEGGLTVVGRGGLGRPNLEALLDVAPPPHFFMNILFWNYFKFTEKL